MQRIYMVLCALFVPVGMCSARKKADTRTRQTQRSIVAVNHSQDPVDMYVITRKIAPASQSVSPSVTHSQRSTTIRPDSEHEIFIDVHADPIAIIMHGDFPRGKPSVKLRGAWRMRQPKLMYKQRTGQVDIQSVPSYAQGLIKDIGNQQLALLELNSEWLEKYPNATISMKITPSGVIFITA